MKTVNDTERQPKEWLAVIPNDPDTPMNTKDCLSTGNDYM